MRNEVTFLGLDPGKTIGYAVLKIDGIDLESIEVGQQRVEDYDLFKSKIPKLIAEVDVVAVEDFIGAGIRSTDASNVLKQIGAICFAAKTLGKTLYVQRNKQRLKYLKLGVDLYEESSGSKPCHHGKDALAHALKAIGLDFHPKRLLKTEDLRTKYGL